MSRRRLIGSIIFSLIIGATATTLIAFACDLRSSTTKVRTETTTATPPKAPIDIPKAWTDRRTPEQLAALSFTIEEHRGLGLRITTLASHETIEGFVSFRFDRFLFVRRAGFPFPALECSATRDTTDDVSISHGYPIPDWIGEPKAPWFFHAPAQFPLKPLPGFALNSIIYAAVLWLLAFGIRQTRRRLRVARHRCPDCNYSRAGLAKAAACPECGATPAVAAA